ncbi:MAG: hypothetical protein HY904_08020 [Deltaproteobacteria bacterium]|nr:hypothetical protein [Deltaproteobacteria bacterium]
MSTTQQAGVAPVVPRSPAPVLAAWVGVLAVGWVITRLLTGALVAPLGDPATEITGARASARFAVAFAVFFAPLLYLLPCLLARRWLRPDARTVALYAGVTFFFGAGSELVMDPAFISVLGRPCYLYRVWPVHGGYTSGVGLVLWPLYGFFVSMLHHAIHVTPALRHLDGHGARAALLAVDAMLLEVAANVFALALFGTWLFRYHAPDLHHFTTAEAFPIYLVGGYAGLRLLHALETHPRRAWVGAAFYVVTAAAVAGPA